MSENGQGAPAQAGAQGGEGSVQNPGLLPAQEHEAFASAHPRAIDIPYGFARKHGVVLLPQEGERLSIAVREGSDPRVLLEVRRHLARSFDVSFVDQAEFDRHLSNHYAMDGSAAAMAGSIEMGADELDMLAADMPTAEDAYDKMKLGLEDVLTSLRSEEADVIDTAIQDFMERYP